MKNKVLSGSARQSVQSDGSTKAGETLVTVRMSPFAKETSFNNTQILILSKRDCADASATSAARKTNMCSLTNHDKTVRESAD